MQVCLWDSVRVFYVSSCNLKGRRKCLQIFSSCLLRLPSYRLWETYVNKHLVFKQQMVKLAGHVFKQQSQTFHMLRVHQNQSAGFAGHFATTNTSTSKVRQLSCSNCSNCSIHAAVLFIAWGQMALALSSGQVRPSHEYRKWAVLTFDQMSRWTL